MQRRNIVEYMKRTLTLSVRFWSYLVLPCLACACVSCKSFRCVEGSEKIVVHDTVFANHSVFVDRFLFDTVMSVVFRDTLRDTAVVVRHARVVGSVVGVDTVKAVHKQVESVTSSNRESLTTRRPPFGKIAVAAFLFLVFVSIMFGFCRAMIIK